MAIVKVKKIQLAAISQHKEKMLEVLQNSGTVNMTELSGDDPVAKAAYGNMDDLQKVELLYANLEFCINLLSKYVKKAGFFAPPLTTTPEKAREKASRIDYQAIIDKCVETEDLMVKAKNEIAALESDISIYRPWRLLEIDLANFAGTDFTCILAGSVKATILDSFIEKLHKLSKFVSSEIVGQASTDVCFVVIFAREMEQDVRSILSENKFSEIQLPCFEGTMKEYLASLSQRIKELQGKIAGYEKELAALAKHIDDLKIIYDYTGWQKEKLEAARKMGETESSFVLNAWIPAKNIETLKSDLGEVTSEFEVTEIKPGKDEVPPVIIKNHSFLAPFESVSRIYGLPKYDELDPTPHLSLFFIIFFALCLTDAGYGLFMVFVTALALKYLNLDDGMRKLVKLLMYGGIVTVFVGALFGGWFSLAPDQVPDFLTKTTESGEKLLIFQKINALTDPITVLILSLSLGFVQILTGVVMKFVHTFRNVDKKAALLDNGTWVFMLFGIGFYILAAVGVLPQQFLPVAKWWVIIAAFILVLTQGRDKKNIFLKFISGVLSLYGLVGYMSDILSYSRLLALGLATSIIGLAVNTIVGLAGGIPYVGWLFMIVIFVGGHIFNLVINALGSFIHSGRLQFVEFFTKFMEGGGDEFRPLAKKSKYVFIKDSN